MAGAERRKCLHCGGSFTPEARNKRHQRYCTAAPCRIASKRASQARWLAKPENQDYHRGPEAVARVQAWRAAHPDYAQRQPPETDSKAWVQEELSIPSASLEKSCNAAPIPAKSPLQDLLSTQPIVIVGLIAHLLDCTLQEDIASAFTRLNQLGQDIQGGQYEVDPAGLEPGTPAPGARAFQLARSPPGS